MPERSSLYGQGLREWRDPRFESPRLAGEDQHGQRRKADLPKVGKEPARDIRGPPPLDTHTKCSYFVPAMTDAPAILATEVPPADWSRALVERQLEMLGRLAEVGLEIAVGLEAQVKGGDQVVQGDIAMAYARVARAVRQTIMLQSKLISDLREQETGAAGRRAAARAGAAGLIGDVIDEARGSDKEQLRAEAAERLRQEDFSDFLARPFEEAVTEIVRGLGLTPDWLALAQDCWSAEAQLCRKAEAADAQPYTGPVEVRWLDDEPSPGQDSSCPAASAAFKRQEWTPSSPRGQRFRASSVLGALLGVLGELGVSSYRRLRRPPALKA